LWQHARRSGPISKETKLGKGDFRSLLPRFTPDAMQRNEALVDLLKRIAAAKNATPAQIALAWLLTRTSLPPTLC
jgi:aryl-alcohol dehydrogenase-like predicted oxidoreductase